MKLSITVAPDLLRAVDNFVAEHPGWDRSKVLDDALTLWYAREQERAMEAQYVIPGSEREQGELADWKRVQRAAAARRFGPR
jgi:hypothetical protein